MPLRSGRRYLKSHRCQVCRKFYSYSEFDYKCSYCFKGTDGPGPYCPSAERMAAAEHWVKENTIDPTNPQHSKYVTVLNGAARMGNFILLAVLRSLHREEGKLLRSTHAKQLFEMCGSVQRGHVIGSHIADWWNIRTPSAGGEWPSYVVCYYGDFDSPYIPRMPARPPRAMLNCTETMGLLRFMPKENIVLS